MPKKIQWLSVLGDSISTYQGASNDPTANKTTAGNHCFYREPFPLQKTYWHRVCRALDLTLCVNNSWSGGNLSGEDDPTSGLNRAAFLARDDGQAPDLVLLFMGINDLGRRIPLARFAADYQKTLAILAARYPGAAVCCVNIPDRDPVLKPQATAFNRAIDEAAAKAGERFFVADLFSCRLNNDFYYDNTVDGLHPDEDGMRIIAEEVERAIRAQLYDL